MEARHRIWSRRASARRIRVRRHAPVLAVAALTLLTAASALVGVQGSDRGAGRHGALASRVTRGHHRSPQRHRVKGPAVQVGNRAVELGAKAVDLPAATAPPAAAPAVLVSAPPLATRENFAFAPYWTLAQSPTFDLDGLSTIAYFAVGVNPNGTLDESGPGWNGFESQDLATLITRAHTLGERVVLTVNDFDQGSLDQLTSSPSAPGTLAGALVPLLQGKNLDGVNFDFEGQGSGDQAGLTNLIASVSSALRAADPHWQITMDTYASSAGDPGGFYNIPALAPSVDAFFVMAYELNLQGAATAVSPLTSGQFSDLESVQQYAAAVPASKIILGTPFFGIDWPTNNGTMGATSTGGGSDIADAQVQQANHPQYWDPVTQTAWTSYLVGTQWHESYYESAYALYQVAQLAGHAGIRGVGIWALGMESDGPQMIAALDGFAPAGGPGSTGPQATTTSPSATTTTTTTHPAAPGSSTTSSTAPASSTTSSTAPPGTTTTTVPVITAIYGKATVSLTPVGSGGVDTISPQGTVANFFTTDPALSCLNGKTLNVYAYGVLTNKRVAVAQQPTDCVNQEFTFPA